MEVPELRIVPVERLILHEFHDEHRMERLMRRLREDGLLRNPPVVAPLDEAAPEGGSYVVLDGANRVVALGRMGAPDALVQVVDYGQVRLETWNHLLLGIGSEEIRALLAEHGLRAEKVDREAAREALGRRAILAYIDLLDGSLGVPWQDGRGQQALAHFVEAYRERVRLQRVQGARLGELQRLYPGATALIVFPRYRPEEILELASNARRLPTGITRHVIPGRALRVNLPLEILESDQPAAAKNRWLGQWLAEKLERHEVRFYEESTYLFDE